MVALVQVFLDVIAALLTFVQGNLIPAAVADVNIIHVAIWTPVVLGLAAGVVAFLKRMWSRGRR